MTFRDDELPPQFLKNINALYGEATAKAWIEELPSILDKLSKRWQFRFIQLLDNLSFNLVAVIQLESTGERAVLKIAPNTAEHLLFEMRCLRCFNKGVARIIEFDEEMKAFLMEYCIPGTPLKATVQNGDDENATRVIAQSILALQKEQTHSFAFKHLSELIPDLHALKGFCDDYMLSKGISLFQDLTSDRSQDIILHGDLHHDNIIQHETSWKIIDPHGYIGDPVAEVGAMIRNPLDAFPTYCPLQKIIETRIHILSEELPFDPKRIKAWMFCTTLLSAAWDFQDFGTLAKFQLEVATHIDKVRI